MTSSSHYRLQSRSPYLEWFKLKAGAKFNLASSGMAGLPLAELGARIEQLEINGPSIYGYDPLLKAISLRYKVPQASVAAATGGSMGNYLALAATTEPDDEVVMERPVYDPVPGAARYLGLRIRHFERRTEENFAINLSTLARHITPQTRVIAITNLHNPSGAFCPAATLREIAAMAADVGAYVMVNEVYREMLYEREPWTAFHIDPERFLIINSLTKAYGLSGLRCGWVLAPPAIVERIWHINDLHGSTYAHPAELLGVMAFEKLAVISAKMKAMLDENRALLKEFLAAHSDLLDYFWPEYGTIVFPRLRRGHAEEFCESLRRDFETTVVPGRFFDCPDRFRLGVGIPTDQVRDGLSQLGKALDRWKASN